MPTTPAHAALLAEQAARLAAYDRAIAACESSSLEEAVVATRALHGACSWDRRGDVLNVCVWLEQRAATAFAARELRHVREHEARPVREPAPYVERPIDTRHEGT